MKWNRTGIAILFILGLFSIGLLIISNVSLPGFAKRLLNIANGEDAHNIANGEDAHQADLREHNAVTMTAPKSSNDTSDSKLFLIFTSWFGRKPWPGLEIPCASVSSCQITYDRNKFSQSDALMFHGSDMPPIKEMREFSTRRPTKQKWILYTHESPINLFRDAAMYNGFFNWTMSYRRDSDFFQPYGTYTQLGSEDRVPEAGKNYAAGKDKLIVWLVSHCGVHQRENVARELMRYISVDVFGSCNTKFNQRGRCEMGSSECDLLLKQYKFHLSLENSFCPDYITEKYWKTPFKHNIVPIVMGGANYDSEVAIPGSFINVADFRSIKALADYLIYLNGNDTAYSQFFQWKRKFKPVEAESLTCQVCAALNNTAAVNTNTVYHNLDERWGPEHACGTNEDKILAMLPLAVTGRGYHLYLALCIFLFVIVSYFVYRYRCSYY